MSSRSHSLSFALKSSPRYGRIALPWILRLGKVSQALALQGNEKLTFWVPVNGKVMVFS